MLCFWCWRWQRPVLCCYRCCVVPPLTRMTCLSTETRSISRFTRSALKSLRLKVRPMNWRWMRAVTCCWMLLKKTRRRSGNSGQMQSAIPGGICWPRHSCCHCCRSLPMSTWDWVAARSLITNCPGNSGTLIPRIPNPTLSWWTGLRVGLQTGRATLICSLWPHEC